MSPDSKPNSSVSIVSGGRMSATDAMLARFDAEVEERTAFVDSLIKQAEERNRDLTAEEMNLVGNANARLDEIAQQAGPLREGARIALESRARRQELHEAYATARAPQSQGPVEYRTAGSYITDLYYAQMGDVDAQQRMQVFNRVARSEEHTSELQ